MKKIIIAAGFVLLTCAVYAQQSITGKVFDSETKEPLIGVSILFQNTTIGTTTNNNGVFNLTNTSSDSIEVRYVGYAPQFISIKNSETLTVALQASVTSMNEVVVTGSRDAQIRSDVPMAINKLSATTI
ncbi:MAG TPA: carboxypeptidase-like regulatory domain-containing protein, partial [Chryseolinea sp.]|nr:carboxypeptidase-like regulatory domain-containing protein [Chryseolinea sp.]